MRCGLSGSSAMAVSLLYCQGWRNLLARRREWGIAINAATSHGGKDHQSAWAEMPPAGVARAQGADRAESRRRADRRMHGPAHRDRYAKPPEPDRRHARSKLAQRRGAGVPYPEELSQAVATSPPGPPVRSPAAPLAFVGHGESDPEAQSGDGGGGERKR